MDTEEDIFAIYIDLIYMVDVLKNLQLDFIFSIRNYCKKKKIYETFCFCRQMRNTKLLKGNWLLANALSIYSFVFILTFASIN